MKQKDEEKTQLAFWGDEELRMRVDRLARKLDRSRAYVLKLCVDEKLPELEVAHYG
jgi:predicted transcriptional regulator